MAAKKLIVFVVAMLTSLIFIAFAWGKNCGEPPIVKRDNLTKEEKRALLLRIAADPKSVQGEFFLPMFLEKKDLYGDVKMTQDTRRYLPPDPEDDAFDKYCGFHAGLALWEGGFDQTILRLVDIRWVFPTEAEAKAYHERRGLANSEGQPEISNSPKIGTECFVFGGNVDLMGTRLTHYYYIFRVQNVVVKLYVCQGPAVEDANKKLTLEKVAELAKICVERIRNYNRAARKQLLEESE